MDLFQFSRSPVASSQTRCTDPSSDRHIHFPLAGLTILCLLTLHARDLLGGAKQGAEQQEPPPRPAYTFNQANILSK